MKRKGFLIILVLIATCASAVNSIIYFRYDVPVSNTYKLLEKLTRVCLNETGQTILYYNQEIYEKDQIQNLFEQKSFLGLTDVYEAKADYHLLDSLLEETLKEEIIGNAIIGNDDENWQVIFMINENSSLDEICRLIDISGLSKRAVKLSFIIYDNDANYHYSSYDDIIANNVKIMNF